MEFVKISVQSGAKKRIYLNKHIWISLNAEFRQYCQVFYVSLIYLYIEYYIIIIENMFDVNVNIKHENMMSIEWK